MTKLNLDGANHNIDEVTDNLDDIRTLVSAIASVGVEIPDGWEFTSTCYFFSREVAIFISPNRANPSRDMLRSLMKAVAPITSTQLPTWRRSYSHGKYMQLDSHTTHMISGRTSKLSIHISGVPIPTSCHIVEEARTVVERKVVCGNRVGGSDE